jgi:glycosyltransferase involved in cell wall biosynthesis
MDWQKLKMQRHRPTTKVPQQKASARPNGGKPKIAFVVANLHWGGTFGFMLNLGIALGDGYEKQYIGWHGKRSESALATYQERVKGSRVFYAGTTSDNLVSAITAFSPDVVVYTGPVNVPGLLAPFTKARFIYVAHTTDSWSDAGIDYGADKVHTVIGTGLGVCTHYREKYGKNNVASLLGAATYFREPDTRDRRSGLKIGYYGNFEPRKKALEIIEEFRRFRKSTDRLLLAGGEAPYAVRYLDKVKKAAQNDPSISLQVNIRDRNAVLSSMDVMVVYSDWEGWPQTMIEAMAAGVPVIARRVCGPSVYHLELPEGAITYIDDLSELGDAVGKLRSHAARLEQAGKAYQFAKERHPITRLAADAKLVFDKAIGRSVHPTYVDKLPVSLPTQLPDLFQATSELPDVSVLMAVWNTPVRILKEAVASVLDQSGVAFELVICDDGSTNKETLEYLRGLIPIKNVTLLFNPKRGLVHARNSALLACRGEFISVLDSDDIMVPGRLAEQVGYLRANRDIALVSAQMDYMNSTGQPGPGFGGKSRTAFKLREMHIWEQPWCIGHSTACYRKDAVISVGGYYSIHANGVAQDLDLWCRIDAAGFKFNVLDVVWCRYRMHDGQLTKTYNIPEVIRATARKYSSLVPITMPGESIHIHSITNAQQAANRIVYYSVFDFRHGDLLTVCAEQFPNVRLVREGLAPDISVVIPAYRNRAHLLSLLRQLDRQTGNFEIIVVSDGCDDCYNAALSFKLSKPLRVFNTNYRDGFGVMLARNIGAAAADGRQLVFFDPDMFLPDGFIEAFKNHFIPGRLISPWIDYIDPHNPDVVVLPDYRARLHKSKTSQVLGFLTQCASVDRRSFYSVGGFDESLVGQGGTDTDFGLRYALRYGDAAYWASDVKCKHLGVSSGQAYRKKQPSKWNREGLVYRRKTGFYSNPANAPANGGCARFSVLPVATVPSKRIGAFRVVTVVSDTQEFGYVNYLKPSCSHYGAELVTLVADPQAISRKTGTLAEKDRLLLAYLETLPDDDVVMFVDGYDTVLLAGPDEIVDKFRAVGSPLVVSAELNCHPEEPGLAGRFPKSPTPYRYLNTGSFIGSVGYLRRLLLRVREQTISLRFRWSNQYRWIKLFLDDPTTMTLDVNCSLFYSAATLKTERATDKWKTQREYFRFKHGIFEHPEFQDEELARILSKLSLSGGRPVCTVTGTKPCVLHFNGPGSILMRTKMQELSIIRPWENT